MGSIFLLTQNTNAIFRPIAIVLGYIMNGIYVFFDNVFNVQNIALTIVIFTIIIYLCMLPLTYQQQKFSKMTQIMNPEIQAIQKKYRGKKDSVSMAAMNEETQAVYRKYGVRPSGSCVFLIIQFLILIPLYRVIYNVPAYVTRVKDTFTDVVGQIMGTSGYQTTMTNFLTSITEHNSVMKNVSLNFTGTSTDAANSIIDVLYKCTSDNWATLAQLFPNISNTITTTQTAVEHFNSFLGASIVYSPVVLIRTSAAEHHFGLICIAVLIPIISALSQFLSVKLMPQPDNTSGGQQNQMSSQMKMMNYFMPIYSFFIVFILPIGVGIYWIAGAIIRIVQQFLINRHFAKMDMQALVEKNQKKAEERQKKRIEKKGVSGAQIQSAASINARQIQHRSMSEKAASATYISGYDDGNRKYKPGSMAAMANAVREYNERSSGTTKSQRAAEAKAAEEKAAAEAKAAEEAASKKRKKNKSKK